jgi:hypothetical protein
MSYSNGPRIVNDGLVLYLDAGNSKSYPGAGISWTDLSGRNNNGTLVNGPTFSSANKGSIIFDGTNDYVNCGKASSISQFSSFSVNCWVKPLSFPSAFNTGRVILRSEESFRIYWYESSGFSNPNRLYFYMNGVDSGLETCTSYLTSNFSTNTWYNISATYTGSSTNLYINSVLVDTKTGKSGNVSSTVDLYLGASVAYGEYYFQGNIAQVSIYNRALSSSEVRENYNATKGRFSL